MAKKIRWAVFLSPWLLVMATIAFSFIDYDSFVKTLDYLTSLILSRFTWVFCLLTFSCVVLVCISFFSPVGKMRVGEEKARKIAPLIDGVCLFALCGGMSASLGQGVLLLSGGIENCSNGFYQSSVALWCLCTIVIVTMFVIPACTGITKGIKILSNINITFYSVIVLRLFLFGPTVFVLDFGVEGIGNYLNDFIRLSLFTGASGGKDWVVSWPSFYWCNWLAWMPITGVFLGKVAKGFTFRQVITAVVVVPALFSTVWIVLFSGTAVFLQMENGSVWEAMMSDDTEAATYVVLRSLPLSNILIGLFLVVLLLSFVTAAHSNTNAMSGICTKGLTVDSSESPAILKVIWGITIGGSCLIMLSTYGINGIKMLSNLAGFPDALLMIFFMVCWIKILKNPERYSKV